MPRDESVNEGDEEGDDAQFLLNSVDNLDGDEDYSLFVDYGGRLDHCLKIIGRVGLPKFLLLLDSCSTLCIICDASLLTDIH